MAARTGCAGGGDSLDDGSPRGRDQAHPESPPKGHEQCSLVARSIAKLDSSQRIPNAFDRGRNRRNIAV